MAVDMDILGHIPQGLTILSGTISQHPDFTSIGFKKPQDQPQQGVFPTAVGPDNANNVMFPDGQINVGKNRLSII